MVKDILMKQTLNFSNLKKLVSKKFILVLLISIPSAIIADYFNIPLAWMLGPMIITSIGALAGLKVKMPKLALSSILIILGLHIGNYIDQNLFNQMINWIWTSVIMLVYYCLYFNCFKVSPEIFWVWTKSFNIFCSSRCLRSINDFS